MGNIFNDDELNQFRENKKHIDVETFLENDERIQGIESSLKRIKEDYKTHHMLFDLFREKKGFILDLTNLGYYKDENKNIYGFLRISLLEKSVSLFLHVTKEENNRFIIGERLSNTTCYRTDNENSISQVIEVFRSKNKDTLDRKLIKDYNLSDDFERFAYRMLIESAHFERSQNNKEDFDKNRPWFIPSTYGKKLKWNSLDPSQRSFKYQDRLPNKNRGASPLYDEDLIEVYRGAVREAVKDHKKFESAEKSYNTQEGIGSSFNMRFFSSDKYSSKRYVTKILGFQENQVDLDSLIE